jgi:hypothetical protein
MTKANIAPWHSDGPWLHTQPTGVNIDGNALSVNRSSRPSPIIFVNRGKILKGVVFGGMVRSGKICGMFGGYWVLRGNWKCMECERLLPIREVVGGNCVFEVWRVLLSCRMEKGVVFGVLVLVFWVFR